MTHTLITTRPASLGAAPAGAYLVPTATMTTRVLTAPVSRGGGFWEAVRWGRIERLFWADLAELAPRPWVLQIPEGATHE